MSPSRPAIALLTLCLAVGCSSPAPPRAPAVAKPLSPASPNRTTFAERAPSHTRILARFDLRELDLGALLPPQFGAIAGVISRCGIDLAHAGLTLDLAIAEPFVLRAELHGAITVSEVTCVLGLTDDGRDGKDHGLFAVESLPDGGVRVANPSAMADGPGAPIALQTLFFAGEMSAPTKVVARVGPSDAPMDVQLTTGPTGQLRLGLASRAQAEQARDILMAQRSIVHTSGDRSLDDIDVSASDRTLVLGLHGMTSSAAASLRQNVIGSSKLPAGSMLPGLLIGDQLLLLKGQAGRAVTRGDVVVFASPKDPKASFAKRVIGVGGDHLEILGHTLRINGASVATAKTAATLALPEQKEPAEIWTETLDGRTYSILHNEAAPDDPEPIDVDVPAGSIFVLGDNRENSFDSRHFGSVQTSAIEGRVVATWASFDDHGVPRWDRIGRVVR